MLAVKIGLLHYFFLKCFEGTFLNFSQNQFQLLVHKTSLTKLLKVSFIQLS